MTPARVAIGTPLVPGQADPGDDVVFIGCGHDESLIGGDGEPCPELARPCSVPLYGVMELMMVRADGFLICRPDRAEDDPRLWPWFERHEVSTPEAVAKYAAPEAA